MRFNDAVIGVVLLIFGTVVIFYSQGFPGLPGQQYGPAFFPSIIGTLFGICGVVLIIQGIAKRREIGFVQLGEWAKSPRHRANFIIVIASLVFYVLVSDFLGFIPTALLISMGLMLRFGVRIVPAAVMSVVSVLAMHFVFYKFLLVPLPWGILEPLVW